MMLTRCPACATTFRVTPEQVKARHGQVRCGRCQHVFDAIEHLVESTPASPADLPTALAVTTASSPPVTPADPPMSEVALPAAAAEDSAATDLINALEAGPAAAAVALAPAANEPDAEPDSLDIPTSPGLDSVLLQPLPQLSPLSAAYAQATATPAARWPWLIGTLITLGALLLQAAIAYRVELAARHPDLRPALEGLCAQFDCRVELPSDPAQVAIEASDLHPAPQQKGKLELTATLRNRATHAQQWPHLEITLTDAADKAVVRKIISPLDFIPAGQNSETGFAANAELAIQLTLDAGELPAAGYRLYLFYP